MQTSTFPGYQRFFLACDEELRRPQADTSSPSAETGNRAWKVSGTLGNINGTNALIILFNWSFENWNVIPENVTKEKKRESICKSKLYN